MSSDGSSQAKLIPTRRVELTDSSQLPLDYSTTPGGTWFSTTPGGTRVIYDRSRLLVMRNSPLSRTPPANLPKIPGVTMVGDASQSLTVTSPTHTQTITEEQESNGHDVEAAKDEEQFPMDI